MVLLIIVAFPFFAKGTLLSQMLGISNYELPFEDEAITESCSL